MPRYLIKSRFILALDCSAKLYYTGKEQYPIKMKDNEFLEALARGDLKHFQPLPAGRGSTPCPRAITKNDIS
jgi:hypothetical protein